MARPDSLSLLLLDGIFCNKYSKTGRTRAK